MICLRSSLCTSSVHRLCRVQWKHRSGIVISILKTAESLISRFDCRRIRVSIGSILANLAMNNQILNSMCPMCDFRMDKIDLLKDDTKCGVVEQAEFSNALFGCGVTALCASTDFGEEIFRNWAKRVRVLNVVVRGLTSSAPKERQRRAKLELRYPGEAR